MSAEYTLTCISCGGTGICPMCRGTGTDLLRNNPAVATPDGLCRDCRGDKRCITCNGSGSYAPHRPARVARNVPEAGYALCPTCRGTRECPVCHGTALTEKGPCAACDYGACIECDGSGQVPTSKLDSEEAAELLTAERSTLTLEMGNEFAPDDPIGRERVAVSTDGSVEYELRRGGVRTRNGTIAKPKVTNLFVQLVRSGFPHMPKHPIPPGASLMSLSRVIEGKPIEKVSFQSFFAYDQPGYGELLRELESLATALRTDDTARLRDWGFALMG